MSTHRCSGRRKRGRRSRYLPEGWILLGLGLLFLPGRGLWADPLPTFSALKAGYLSSQAYLYDHQGRLLHELRVARQGQRLSWVNLQEISPSVGEAVLGAEDRRFYTHRGVDWRALGAAFLGPFRGQPLRGASTLSMQLVALLEEGLQPRQGRRTWGQKWAQVRAALALEKSWSKAEILEAYLNLASFRSELQGIGAASWGLFDKHPSGLNQAEALLLAALLPAPNSPPDHVARRACRLAPGVFPQIDCDTLKALATHHLVGPYPARPAVTLAPHVARQLLRQAGEQVVTTLDADVQRFTLQALQQQLLALAPQQVEDGAVLVVDNQSGGVLAYLGNGGRPAAWYVDGVQARRQAGSTLKPFLYATALQQRLLTAASLLEDSPLNLVTPSGLYVPQNYDRDFKGLVSVRTSLAASLNIPAVRTLMLVGTEAFLERLRQLGFTHLRGSGDYYGLALALGAPEMSLAELVNAYRTLANGGQWTPLTLVPESTPAVPRPVFTPEAAFIVSDILADRQARSLTFGLENPLATPFWTAVKTGTSKDMRDNWCLGYSRQFTVGVWVGNFSGAPMRHSSGVTGAAPLWLEIMRYLHRTGGSPPPPAPPQVVAQRVTFQPPIEPARSEWFLAGTEMAVVELLRIPHQTRIAYPGAGAILALDPDIPADRQRVFFRTRAEDAQLTWILDGKRVGSGQRVAWQPTPGRHVLNLTGPQTQILDTLTFEVRGSAVP